MHSSEPDGNDLRIEGATYELSELILTQEKMADLILKYAAINVLKEPNDVFLAQLLARDSWFVEVGNVGLVALTGIIPNFMAMFTFYNWDMKLGKDRIEPLRGVISKAFLDFNLLRIAAAIPIKAAAMQRHLIQVGFRHEGIVRNGRMIEGKPTDVILMSILPEEAQWDSQ